MKIDYWWEMPNKWTFKQPKVLKFIMKHVPFNSDILVPFAGLYRFGVIDNSRFVYNDINKEIKANHHIDAYRLVWFYPRHHFDCIIADPPFSFHQSRNTYRNRKYVDITRWRISANHLLKPGGIYIELGFNSTGLRQTIAKKIALGVCCIGSVHNDILILIQKKLNNLNSRF